jgi:long-chain acyl-CoA synthetase
MEFASPEQRRLETIRSHIDTSPTNDQSSSLFLNATASSASPFFKEDSYSVVLPEKLDTGKWNVYRFLKNQSFLCCYVWFFDKCV